MEKESENDLKAGAHDFELILSCIPQYFDNTGISNLLKKFGLTEFKRVHKAIGWKFAFVSFEVLILN